MLDEIQVNDEQLEASDIRQLESADEIAHFFAKLRYDVDARTNIPDYAVLGMGSEDMRQHIRKIELIGKDPEDGDIRIYLFEVRSVTAKLRNDIARRFRERPENALLVLTKDYEELEFVILERVLSRSQSRRAALKQAIRPMPLTVSRLHPTSVALRVLKRFTFTEEDAAYQWEKLRSAYMLAEWSEEYFNNRALFSDYYLKERLTDPQITPAWDEDVRPAGREIYKHIVTARKDYTRQTADVIRKGLYEPIFTLLGFDFAQQKSGSSSAEKAAYLLYTPGAKSKPIAAALTYVWSRNLDDMDESRERAEDDGGTPFEIPGATVVSLLEAQVAPWVIVTNGKLWRLYSSTASNKATNYYEIDLEEAIAANDQITALQYWWLMFRQQAFTGFLDDLLKNSTDYAKELGDRLKDRVFVEIFPQFAKGFIADMRAKGVSNLDEKALATVFSGTMTFLYRLMFILYAESLELLPVHEVHGYREHSLYRLKQEIADTGGMVLDESPDKLGRQYKTGSTEIYDRLQTVFNVIDQGSDELNMPTYNGGLFSPETDSGRFLATYAIPDRYLALGLDRLTRDVDTRTQALVFIDFKSLGVRHLGSIYEGLLEFKLRVAGEQLAVTKEKGKEVYKPAQQVKKPLVIVDKGEVYLENDKQERKATGSYYTPDYIVKYIVRHTVGPVLERKFAELEKRLLLEVKNGVKPFEIGKGNPPQTKKIATEKPYVQERKVDDTFVPLIRGSLIDRYTNFWSEDYWISYGPWLAAQRDPRIFFDFEQKLIVRQTGYELVATKIDNSFVARDNLHILLPSSPKLSLDFILCVINSRLLAYFYGIMNPEYGEAFAQVKLAHLERLPIFEINFTTFTEERKRLTQQAIGAYDIGDNPGLLQRVQVHIDGNKTDVVHDLLAHLAQRMIDLNKQKQSEVKRFLEWVERRLRIQPKNDASTGLDSLTGKTTLQGYLGDYQQGEGELPWREFHYRLYQNRNRFAVSLSDVEGEIQREYEQSLETLIPIKRELARTDALIDKIVYRLYGLTDEEIELIERPQYEQALADVKAQVVADDKIKDDEEKIEKIAEGILPVAQRFFERVEPKSVEEMLDSELPTWRSLPPETPTLAATRPRRHGCGRCRY